MTVYAVAGVSASLVLIYNGLKNNFKARSVKLPCVQELNSDDDIRKYIEEALMSEEMGLTKKCKLQCCALFKRRQFCCLSEGVVSSALFKRLRKCFPVQK